MKSTLLLATEIGFVLITIIFLGLILNVFNKAMTASAWDDEKKTRVRRWTIISVTGWLAFLAFWSLSGIMADFSRFPFNFMPVIIIPLVVILWLTFTRNMRDLLLIIPQEKLLALQSFRIFVEVLLWMLFVDHTLPEQMTFEGRNFDILAGITGPIVAIAYAAGLLSPRFLFFWNLVCLGLLINIVTVAILSTPSPVRVFMNDPANTIVTTFPICVLPGVLVPMAYMLHFFSLRKISVEKKELSMT